MSTSTLSMTNFDETITGDGITLIDFWAEWCGPCRQFGPIFEQAAEENPDATFAKVDTEAEQDLAQSLGIMSIPTLMIFRDGIQLFSQPGALSKSALDDLLRQVRDLDMDVVRKELETAEAADTAESDTAESAETESAESNTAEPAESDTGESPETDLDSDDEAASS